MTVLSRILHSRREYAQVGIILEALDRLGLADKTVVVLLSDNGLHLGEQGMIGRKQTLFEAAARVPLIVAAPGVQAGVASPRIVELVDLYPTLAEKCGLPAPEGLEGTSFVPLLADPNRPWKSAAFVTRSGRSSLYRSVHTERFSYVESIDGTEAELYDHEADPEEMINLAADPGYADTVTEMKRLIEKGWRGALPPAR